MINILTAQSLVENELAKKSLNERSEDQRIITGIFPIERDLGWLFLYNTRAFAETFDYDYELIGNSPIIVDKDDGSLHYTGTGRSIEEYIKEFRKKKLAS